MSAFSSATVFSVARLTFAINVLESDFLARHSESSTNTSKAAIANDPFRSAVYGKNRCPCVGIAHMEGYYGTHLDDYFVQYPVDAGATCSSWELTTHPDCKDGGGPQWCTERWCYVDPCNCDLEELPRMSKSGVTYQGAPAYWSYETCGFDDLYSAEMSEDACVMQDNQADCQSNSECAWDGTRCGGKKAVETCKQAFQLDESIYGQEDCRCVGLGGKEPGKAYMHVNSTARIAYPSDVGSTCKAWEADVHPDCLRQGEKPEWCTQRWCFVDPCKCKSAVPPKMVLEENQHMKFQGKVAFWSAEACGNTDTWVAAHAGEYCISQKTEHDCAKLGERESRCAWTGKACVAKALAGICEEQSASGVMGFDHLGLKSRAVRTQSMLAAFLSMAAIVLVCDII